MQASTGTRKIVFECSCETKDGERLLIVGSARDFGDWDAAQGLVLTTAPDIYPTWRSSPVPLGNLPADEDIEYKYVKAGSLDSIWEKGDNRVLNLSDCQGLENEVVVKDGHFYLGLGRRSHVVPSVSVTGAEPSAGEERSKARLAAVVAEASERASRLAAEQQEQQLEIQRLETELVAARDAKLAADQAAQQAEQQAAEQAQIQKLEAELALMRDAKAKQHAAQVETQKAADHAVKQAEQQAAKQAQQAAEMQKLESELAMLREAKAESERLKGALEKEKRERERSRTRRTTHTKHLERMIERSRSAQRRSDSDSGEKSPRSRTGSEAFTSPSTASPKALPMPGSSVKPVQLESKMPVLPKSVLAEAEKKHSGHPWPTGIKDSLNQAVTTARSIEEALSKATAAEATALQELRYTQLRALSMDLGEIEAVVAKQGPPSDSLDEVTVTAICQHKQEVERAQAAYEQHRAELEREVAMLRRQVESHVPKKGKSKPRPAGVFVLIIFLAVFVAMARNPMKTRFGVSDVDEILNQASQGVRTLRGCVRTNMAMYELKPSSGR